ncbi:hypothetical protein D9613_008128 [Agrocybe pediades]|uniref:Uncharacterized protein n=1 Tax=Agrocybe pediades TaxID=84607 RepID=A0A8H4QME2_9AGAR|nr:hypothetical protein D9613_008128 [Agrocybe pediades]
MKFFAAPLLVLATFTSTVFAQAAGNEFVDDILARDDSFDSSEAITAREFTQMHARYADEVYEFRRDLERLERRGLMECYRNCAQLYTGKNKADCWKKCDHIWHGHV